MNIAYFHLPFSYFRTLVCFHCRPGTAFLCGEIVGTLSFFRTFFELLASYNRCRYLTLKRSATKSHLSRHRHTPIWKLGLFAFLNSSILCQGTGSSQGIHERKLLLQYPLDFCRSSWDSYWKIVPCVVPKLQDEWQNKDNRCGKNDFKLSSQAFKMAIKMAETYSGQKEEIFFLRIREGNSSNPLLRFPEMRRNDF